MKKFIRVLLLSLIAVFCFVGCNQNADSNDKQPNHQPDSQPTTIDLNLENYTKYFALNNDVIDYKEETYLNKYQQTVTRVTQTTKFSIIKLKENITYNHVVITITNGASGFGWEGEDGDLILSYDGSGSLTLRATKTANNTIPMRYNIKEIKGSITIK